MCAFFVYLDVGGRFRIVDRGAYVSQYDPGHTGPPMDWETEIYSVDVTGSFASVKLRIECSLVKCIDYFNMMKLGGRWWIVHKISHGELKQANQ